VLAWMGGSAECPQLDSNPRLRASESVNRIGDQAGRQSVQVFRSVLFVLNRRTKNPLNHTLPLPLLLLFSSRLLSSTQHASPLSLTNPPTNPFTHSLTRSDMTATSAKTRAQQQQRTTDDGRSSGHNHRNRDRHSHSHSHSYSHSHRPPSAGRTMRSDSSHRFLRQTADSTQGGRNQDVCGMGPRAVCQRAPEGTDSDSRQ